jgi:hypothetical protein
MNRIVDPSLFVAEAVHIDWLVAARKRGQLGDATSHTTSRAGAVRASRLVGAVHEGRTARLTAALRWHVAAHRGNFDGERDRGIGLPTGPFTVWRRASFSSQLEHTVPWRSRSYWQLPGYRGIELGARLAMARVEVTSSAGGFVFGLADPSTHLSAVTRSVAPAGTTQVELHAPGIAGLLVPPGMSLNAVAGVTVDDYQAIDGWEEIEIVGLPVDPGKWTGIGDHAQDQGPVGALVAPRDAAVDRLHRGTPPFGWFPLVAPGVAAPAWEPPDADALVDDLAAELLPHLREALARQQVEQMLQRIGVELPPPATLDGNAMPADPSTAKVAPITVLQVGVGTDPFLSLALGYGTNVSEDGLDPDVKPFHDGSRWDYMITAPYARGLDGESDPVELVAYALRPVQATPPPVPAALAAEHRAHESPATVDDPWAASAIVRWQRPPKTTLFRVASYAATRHEPGAADAEPLMEKRPAGGFEPIAPARSTTDPEGNLVHLTDRRLIIPNDPGSRSVRYSVATQDLFGLWSAWRGGDHTATQPPPVPPRLVAARLDLPAPASGFVCAGDLVVDFTWDWTDRRPRRIFLAGRLYAAASRSTPPPSSAPPAGLDRTIAGGQPAVVVEFSGDVASVDGIVTERLRYLSPEGDREVTPGSAQSDEVRRYRLRIPGFSVDFATTPHAGLALWVRGDERLAPHHPTATTGPLVVYASDPVPRPMLPPIVPLGSLPDAEGRSHGKLSWPAVPGAAGYHVYTADELTLLAHHGEPEPDPDATLSARYQTLIDAFTADQDRRPFTRTTSRPVTGTTLDVALPRGSRAIHTYVVITTGAGNVEGPWPGAAEAEGALLALASPRLASPPPPELLATAHPATGAVRLTLTTRPGHAVDRIDLHRVRVDDAARSFETMGPPIVTVPGAGGAGWTRTPVDGGGARYAGTDATLTPSWRRVWYRAVAWGAPDGLRGLVPGRSQPSNPFSLVVPPGPPELSTPVVSWPGGSPADVQISFTSPAPVAATALGPHRLELRLDDVTDPSAPAPVLDVAATLDALPTQPPATGDGWWRVPSSTPGEYRVLVRRSSAAVPLGGIVRLVDPLGRVAQQRIDVAAGSVLPEPDLSDVQLVPVGGDWVLAFTSDSPLAYVVRVTATPRRMFPIPFPRPGRLPVPRPPLLGRPLVAQAPLGDLPVVSALPGGTDPLVVVRQRGTGPRHAYAALARVPVTRFEVRLTSPDGRTAAVTREVS